MPPIPEKLNFVDACQAYAILGFTFVSKHSAIITIIKKYIQAIPAKKENLKAFKVLDRAAYYYQLIKNKKIFK